MVNGFYQWAVRQGHVVENPLVQRPSRGSPPVGERANRADLG
jgi:hypothetical protein